MKGFNTCNPAVYDSIISDDLEFYHHRSGITNGKDAFIATIKKTICGGTEKIKRTLAAGTSKVYALYENNILYAAIQEGDHHFFRLKNGGWGQPATAKFTHLWSLGDNIWKLKRVLSDDH